MIREANLHWQYQDTETGLLMPWYTLPALAWLKKQDISQWEVFEYGAGYSTIWWRSHCQDVISIDHDPVWAKAMNSIISKLEREYIEFPAIMLESTRHEMGFDCIIVDGEHRFECVEFSRDYVAHGGYMIVDNYGQTDFPSAESIDALLEGWEKQIFKQPNHSDWCTAVFRKP
jgi:hypothetical protein